MMVEIMSGVVVLFIIIIALWLVMTTKTTCKRCNGAGFLNSGHCCDKCFGTGETSIIEDIC